MNCSNCQNPITEREKLCEKCGSFVDMKYIDYSQENKNYFTIKNQLASIISFIFLFILGFGFAGGMAYITPIFQKMIFYDKKTLLFLSDEVVWIFSAIIWLAMSIFIFYIPIKAGLRRYFPGADEYGRFVELKGNKGWKQIPKTAKSYTLKTWMLFVLGGLLNMPSLGSGSSADDAKDLIDKNSKDVLKNVDLKDSAKREWEQIFRWIRILWLIGIPMYMLLLSWYAKFTTDGFVENPFFQISESRHSYEEIASLELRSELSSGRNQEGVKILFPRLITEIVLKDGKKINYNYGSLEKVVEIMKNHGVKIYFIPLTLEQELKAGKSFNQETRSKFNIQ